MRRKRHLIAAIIFLGIALLLATQIQCETKAKIKIDWKFKTLQYSFITLDCLDLYTTYKKINTGRFRESNPIARWYLEKPIITTCVSIGANLGIYYGMKHVYKKNKTLAYIALGIFVFTKSYAVIHNIGIK